MRRFIIVTVAITVLLIVGCQGQNSSPTLPFMDQSRGVASGRMLWGLYDVWFDSASGEFEVATERSAEFTANVTKFLDGPPIHLGIQVNSIKDDIFDIDVILIHPFPGLDKYTGFDVMGVFMGNGSLVADWNPSLAYGGAGDQRLLNPDGYTRWFNPAEFNGGMPLLSYYKGKLAPSGYQATATLCPYKYFADNLSAKDDLWAFLTNPSYSDRGAFRPTTNRRNYVIQFPTGTGIKFNYAVVANWEPNINEPGPPTSLDDFPASANAPEAVAVSVDTSASTLFWNPVDGGGGKLIADISVFDWSAVASESTSMDEYVVKLSSSMLNNPSTLAPSEMTPVGSGSHFYTYHVEIDPDSIMGTDQAMWVVVEYPGFSYANNLGVSNNAGGNLQAAFKHEFAINANAVNKPPVVTGVDGPTPVTDCEQEIYSVTAVDPDGDPLVYTWSVVPDGQPDDFSIIGEDQTAEIKWKTYGEGAWLVNCRVSDGVNPAVDAVALKVDVTHMENCCPDAPNAAYPYTSTPITMDGWYQYLMPAADGGTFSESTIDMDFLHDTTDRLVISCRTQHQIACVTPGKPTGTNFTQFVAGVDAMSIDVTMDNRIVYVKFDNSVLNDVTDYRDKNWPSKTKAVQGADTSFHVFDTVTMTEVGTGFDVGAKIQAVTADEYRTIWVMDENNVMHCFEESGSTYVENAARNVDMIANGSDMQGLVYDIAIDFHNECFYILTNATIHGYLYRVECDGSFYATVDGNPNPIVDIWAQKCTDKADIVIDNYAADGSILDGGQDAQILCVANIEMAYNIYASKIEIARVDASLGNKMSFLFEGIDNVGYGATCTAINGITNKMFVKCGPPYGNQYIVHECVVPAGEWE